MLSYHSLYLLEFFHEIKFGMKAASSIDNHRVSMAAIAGLNGIIGDRSGVATGLMGNDFGIYFLSPVFKLLNSCCSKSICCRQYNPFSLRGQNIGQLSNARRLA